MSLEEKFAILKEKETKRASGEHAMRELRLAPEAPGGKPVEQIPNIGGLKSENERKDLLIAEQQDRIERLERRVEAQAADSAALRKQLDNSDHLAVELQDVIKGFEHKEIFEWPAQTKLSPELRKLIVSFLERGDMGGLENMLDRLIRYDDKLPTLLKHTYFKEKVEELYGRYFKRKAGLARRASDTHPGVPLAGISGSTTMGFGPNGNTLGILFIDLDNFKQLNDTRGHLAGDAALLRISEVLGETLRQNDIKGRFGGEELEVAIELENVADSMNVARKVVEAIRNADIQFEGQTFRVTASVGVAELKEDEDLDGLIKRANWAMKYAKHLGKNRFIPAELEEADAWAKQMQEEDGKKENS